MFKPVAKTIFLIPLIALVGACGPAPTVAPPTATAMPASATLPAASATALPPLSGSGGGVIAFESERDGNRNLYVMNADGTDQRQLTVNPAVDEGPSWSPDGQYIAFQSQRRGSLNIYVLDVHGGAWADDSQVLVLTTGTAIHAAWSPAPPGGAGGTQIAFSQLQIDGSSDIFLINPDKTGRQRLTNNKGVFNAMPAWSHDGEQIAFATDRDDGNREIYVMNRDGSTPQRLTNHPARDYSPTWSPDGTQIAFVSERDGNMEIYVLNVGDALQGSDGANPRRLTNNPASDEQPNWSPDGTRIAFSSNRSGRMAIYVMNPDGTGLQQLSKNDSDDSTPVWRR